MKRHTWIVDWKGDDVSRSDPPALAAGAHPVARGFRLCPRGAADGRTAAAAFMLGASAVQVGTAFLRCEEADVRDAHRAALAEGDDACTVVTDVISGRPCRYIRNKLIDDLVASGLKPLAVPAQQSLTQRLAGTGNREWTALTSGQSAALARAMTAAELVERLADETTQRLRAFA